MYGGGDSAMGLFPLSAAFLSAGGIGTRGKPLETVGRKARGWGAGQPHYARSAAIRQTVGNGGAAKPEAKAHLRYARSVTEFFASKNGQRREDLFMKNSKIFRRGFAWLLTLSMCLGMLQVTAFAEETEAGAGGDVTVSVVNVSSDAPQVSSSDTAAVQQESSAPSADAPSGDAGNAEDSTAPADSSDDTEESENGTPAAGASEDAEDSESSALPAVDSDDETDGTDENDADIQAEQNEEETPEAAEDDAAGQDGTFNLAQTERPEQSDTVSVGTGTTEDQTEGSTPESGKNWEIFYDKENDVYKLTFNIDSDAEGDQVIDMTHALKLLNEYAQSAEKPKEPVKDFDEPGLSAEDQAKLDAYEKEKKDWDEKDYPWVCEMVDKMNRPGWASEHTMEEVVKEFNTNPYKGFYGIPSDAQAAIPVKPDVAEVDKDSPEYQEYLGKLAEYEAAYAEYQKDLIDYNRRLNADVLEPGDIRKFMIFLSSSSNHTYKYQEGSFTLATPDFGQQNSGVIGFDGQELKDNHVTKEETVNISLNFAPLRELYESCGVDPAAISLNTELTDMLEEVSGKEHWGGNEAVEKVLAALGYTEGGDLSQCVTDYILNYYGNDNIKYSSLSELFEKNALARADATATKMDRPCTFDGTKLSAILSASHRYDNFYQALFSFAYGDKADIEKLLGEMTETNGRFEYDNDEWTDDGLKNALYYYMAHKEIWETTDKYFQELLKEGLTADQATWASFMMALNIDGELSGNGWQLTKWPWYNSIKLEQMDIDFSLTKTDEETGEAITDSETGFQVYYIDKVKSDDGTVSDVKMYCSYDAETNSYTFVPTESTVWTKDGKLDINYAMMKDIVYYLQETVAPEGYERDTNVYIIMNEEDYNAMSDEDKAALGEFDKFLETQKSEDGLKVSVEFTNAKVQIPTTTPEEPTPPPTPEEPDDPTPPTTPDEPDRPTTPDEPDRDPDVDVPEPEVPLSDMPEEPFVSISEEDVPLADTPEEVEIDDPEVPMGDVPRTGDAPVFPLAAAALCICGMLLAKLGKGNKEM